MTAHTVTTTLGVTLVAAILVIIALQAPWNIMLRVYIWWHELILGTLPAESARLRYAKAGLREVEIRAGIKRALKSHTILERQALAFEDALRSIKHLDRGEPFDNYTVLDYLAAMAVMDKIAHKIYKTPVDKEMDL